MLCAYQPLVGLRKLKMIGFLHSSKRRTVPYHFLSGIIFMVHSIVYTAFEEQGSCLPFLIIDECV